MTLVRTHTADGTADRLQALTAQQTAALPPTAAPGWSAVPPVGSDWEDADWDALAHRAGL